MLEHVTRAVYYLGVHLLYASMVWLAAWGLTSIRNASATTKYWIWVATSLNFILPIGAVLDWLWTPYLSWATPLSVVGVVAARISQSPAAVVFLLFWWLGVTLMLGRTALRLYAERGDPAAEPRRDRLDTRPGFLARGVPVRITGISRAPAAHGILRPYIALPEGIDRLLSAPELDAVLIHELTHAKRRDNLIRLVHEVGLCLLWFHPLVWITGSRMSLYRELSCDESVIRRARGGDLLSALAKLANPETAFLLQAGASSFMSHRLARLAAPRPQRWGPGANALLTVVFAAALLGGVLGTISHTACCFLARH